MGSGSCDRLKLSLTVLSVMHGLGRMKLLLGTFLSCAVLSAADVSDLNACTYKADNGDFFDLSGAIKG